VYMDTLRDVPVPENLISGNRLLGESGGALGGVAQCSSRGQPASQTMSPLRPSGPNSGGAGHQSDHATGVPESPAGSVRPLSWTRMNTVRGAVHGDACLDGTHDQQI